MYHFISPLSLPQIVHLSVYSFVHPPHPSTSIEWRNVRRIALRRRRRKRKRRLL